MDLPGIESKGILEIRVGSVIEYSKGRIIISGMMIQEREENLLEDLEGEVGTYLKI